MTSPLATQPLRVIAAVLACPIAAPPASAQVCAGGRTELLSQLPDYADGFKSDATGNPQIVAEHAQIVAAIALESITVWGGFGPGNNPTNDFTLIIHAADGSGLPGGVIYAESGIATSLVATGSVLPPPLLPLDEYRATLTPATAVILPAGAVWFEIYNDAAGSDAWHWLTGPRDPQSGGLGCAVAYNAPGGPWFGLSAEMAIVVCGSSGGIGASLCFGDGTGTVCPCFNDGGASEGCANSSGSGGTLAASGSTSVAAGDLVLHGAQLVPPHPGLFFQGNAFVNGGAGAPFGDGIRCCGQGVERLQVVLAHPSGESATTVDIASEGGVAPGDTRCYQLWYRDPFVGPCGSTFNLTNALSIAWLP